MQNVKWLIVILLVSSFAYTATSQKPKVELAGTEVLKFTSSIDSQEYVLYINLPENYAKTNKKYPVLYVTDGQWFFASMYVGYGGQHYDGFLPDLITVGITWPDNYDASRKRDFTPDPVEGIPNSGNAPKFLAVIKNEIIKLVTANYRVEENDKALYGTSLGGVFAIYTLFHEPSLFNRYIIISPALEWGNGILFKYEKSFAEKNRELNAKVFISSGEYEEAVPFKSSFKRFVSQLKASHYKGLDLEDVVISKMGHSGSGTVGGIIGLQYIYSKPELQPDNSLLDKYAGRYVSGKDSSLITRLQGNLYYQGDPSGRLKLFAETPVKFYAKGFSGSVEFIKDDKGHVSGFNLTNNDTSRFFKRIKYFRPRP
jgi:predicted alpha/beta superfamily hydrolase